jgi:hypothetical protein
MMPVYTIRNDSTEEYYEVNMSYEEFKKLLEDNSHLHQIFKMPATVTGTVSTLRQAGGDWQDMLKKIKKSSGKDNTINV